MESEQIANILSDTREYIEEHGWSRGDLVTDEGRACLMGGIGLSQGWIHHDRQQLWQSKLPEVNEVLFAVWRVLFPQARRPVGSRAASEVIQWNDNTAGNQQEVLDVLAKAEKLARGLDPASI
jgi:hypothetical protein